MKEYLSYEKCEQITKDGYTPQNNVGPVMDADGNISNNEYLFADDDVWAVTQDDWDAFYTDDTNTEEPEEPEETELEMYMRTSKENYNKYLLALADLNNVRKRTAEEKANIQKYQDEKIVKDLLPIIDNFERALGAFVVKDETNEANKQGVELIYKQLIDMLAKHEVSACDIKEHDKFSDANMNAVGLVNVPEFNTNEVISVSKKGYTLKDKVIRFADVLVQG